MVLNWCGLQMWYLGYAWGWLPRAAVIQEVMQDTDHCEGLGTVASSTFGGLMVSSICSRVGA